MTFNARMEIVNVNPYAYVSAARASAIKPSWRRPIPVLVPVNGQPKKKPWRINMVPVGDGAFYLYLHGDVRRVSKTKVGDRIRLEVEFDAAYRNGPMHPMPRSFRRALVGSAKAMSGWEALIPSRKKEILRNLSRLMSQEARVRNITRAIHALSGKRSRILGRDWSTR